MATQTYVPTQQYTMDPLLVKGDRPTGLSWFMIAAAVAIIVYLTNK